ncbi:MAG: hemerythrin domain-containing protein [Alphaproteobacteria bacterium]|uniref:Hemerythrin domain-containing protein n=1 Tax=Candidatus Nitrobium versatile TaxID=2884831 RepID=A0A953M0U6_9BACT|nr:hemerythrin domain-containing protein [Candidatus Nitrobium versatile]
MNIFELLKNDHEKALNLFDELEGMQGESGRIQGSKADSVFNKLKQELEIHMMGEEELLYSVLKEEETTRSTILESYEEHHVAKLLLNEMASMPKDEQWMAKLAVLRESVEHHVEEEEGELFEEAQEIIDENRANEIGRRMADMKKEQMSPASR